MHAVHTAGLPPNQGRITFPSSGCTWNSKNALKKIVIGYRAMGVLGKRSAWQQIDYHTACELGEWDAVASGRQRLQHP
jgi:hypothetical protein